MDDILDIDSDKARPIDLKHLARERDATATAIDVKADAGKAQLGVDRDAEFERRKQERSGEATALQASTADLQQALTHRHEAKLPDAHLGSPIDPADTQKMAWGLMAMSLVGAAGGRKHWGMATAALDGMLRGMKEGAEEKIKEKQAEFKREFDTAIQKQQEANRVYEDVLNSKKLSLNMQAEMMRIHAAANQDWDMQAAAKAKDFDGMYKRAAQARGAADKLRTQATAMQERLDARREKAEEKRKAAEGGQGLSERYSTDPAYKQNVDYWAKFMQGGNALPPRFAQSGAGKKMMPDILQVVPTLGEGNPGDMTANRLNQRQLTAEAQKIGTQSASVAIATKELNRFIPLAEQAVDAVPRTAWKPINQLIQAGENTWSPEQGRLVVANRSVQNAFAQLIQRGAPTVHSLAEAEAMLSTADSPAVYKAKMKQLRQEAEQADAGLKDAHEDLMQRARGSGDNRRAGDNVFGSEGEAKAAADRGDLKPGTRITINGQTGVWQ